MSEETVSLLFESDIVANIDIRAAQRKLTDLGRKVGTIETKINGLFSGLQMVVGKINLSVDETADVTDRLSESLGNIEQRLILHSENLARVKSAQDELIRVSQQELEGIRDLNDQYSDRIDWLEEERISLHNQVNEMRDRMQAWQESSRLQDRSIRQQKEEVRVIEETTHAVDDLSNRMRILMEMHAGRVQGAPGFEESKSFGTFEGITIVRRSLSELITEYTRAGMTITEIWETISRTIKEHSSIVAAQSNKAPQAVVNAWQGAADELVNMSIIPDLFVQIKKYLVDIMSDIVNKHVKLVAVDMVAAYHTLSADILDAVMGIDQKLADIGRNAAAGMMSAIERGILEGGIRVAHAIDVVSDGITDQFKYLAGGIFDILTFKGKADRLRNALGRATTLGMEKTVKRIRNEMDYYAVDIEDAVNTTNHQLRVFRESWWDTARNVGLAVDTMIKGQIPLGQSLKGVGIAFDQMFTVIGRNIGIQQKQSSVLDDINRTIAVTSQSLSGYRRENELLDRGLRRMAESVDMTADEMKKQGQVLIKQHELRRQQFKEQQTALGKWLAAYEYARQIEAKGTSATAAEWDRVKKRLTDAVKELERLGIASTVYKGVAANTEELYKKLQKYGTAQTGITADFQTVARDSMDMIAGLDNELKKMVGNFPKQLSMWNRAIQDVEQESKHFLTTLRDGGKISTERLQDLLLAYQNLAKESRKMRQVGALVGDPNLLRWYENVERNSLKAIRDFTIMAQRARTVEAVKEKLFGTTKKLTNSIITLGTAAAKHIPIIGKKAQVSEEQMDKFRAATDRVRSSSGDLSLALSGIDPVFDELTGGLGRVGEQFSSVMSGMEEVARVKTGSMIKTFTALKIAALGVIGIFGGLIIGTGKLAAEITTLNITLRTVATNLGVPISLAEHLVEVLKNTGITTRESTIALTQWMRAGLAFEWTDPILDATFRLEDLARAAQQVAVTMGENSSETFARFIDFIQTGNSQLLNQVGIMKNANQMYEEYADAINKSVKALTSRERYEALISGLMRESTKLQGVYTEAMKSASKQLGSMKRYIEELRYEWGKHFEPILALVIYRFNQLLKYLTDIPEKTKKTVTTFVTIATAVSGLVLGLGLLLPKLNAVLSIVKVFSGLLLGKFGLLLGLISAVAAIFARWFMKIEVESDGVQGLVDRVDKLLDSFGGLKKLIQPVERWLRSFFAMISYHVERIKFLVDELVGGFSEWVKRFKEENPELINLLEKTRKVFGDLFAMIWRVIDLILGAIEALLAGDWEKFFEKVKRAGRFILAWFLEYFFEVVRSAYEWGKNIISAFGKGLMDKAKIIIPKIMTAIGNLLGAFLEGHSPAKIGPLSQVDIWGEGIMDSFLRSMAGKRFRFDEDMFEGIGSLGAKARVWGDNIVDVFAFGITNKAAQAIGPAMGYLGGLIAKFLEGHSPPEVGPLSEIMDWGRNAFETFLAGFEMADFSFLDRALDLIRRRLQLIVEDSAEAGRQVAQAMLAAREYMAGAIAEARATGGPLDLSEMKELILGPLRVLAGDVGAVLEAAFEAMQAESEIKYLEEQIENAIKARAEAAGLVFDETLYKELQRQLENANREVSRAQRRLSAVQREAGKYGVNVLTWEEINAQAQVNLAERRRDEVQDQIDVQEQIQSEIEGIRNEVEAQYSAELEALRTTYEAAQERADYLNALLEQRLAYEEELARANEQINETISGGTDIAEELADGFENVYEGLEEVTSALSGISWPEPIDPPSFSDLFNKYFGDLDELLGIDEIKQIGIGQFLKTKIGEVWDWFVATPVGQFLDEIGAIPFWETVATEVGQFWGRVLDLLKTIAKLPETISEKLGKFIGIDLDWKKLLRGVYKFAEEAFKVVMGIIKLIPSLFTGLLGGGWTNFLNDLGSLTDTMARWFGSTGQEIFAGFIQIGEDIRNWFAELPNKLMTTLKQLAAIVLYGIHEAYLFVWEGLQDIIQGIYLWFDGIITRIKTTIDQLGFIILYGIVQAYESVITFFQELPGKIGSALESLWAAITQPFIDAYNYLVGNSLIPDLINGIVDWIAGLPQKILNFAQSVLDAAIEIGNKIYTGIKEEIDKIIERITGWFDNIIENITLTATNMWAAAHEVAMQIFNAIYDVIFNEETGIVAKIGGWIQSIVDIVKGAWQWFYDAAYSVGEGIISGIKDAIETLKSGLTGIIKGIWNNTIRLGFNKVLSGVADAVNRIIDLLNSAWTAIGSPSWVPGFPISHVWAPQLPELQVGGIVMDDVVARLHAGEVVMPLDRLESVMRSMGLLSTKVPPVFAPVMNFHPGASPQQIVPAVDYALSLYEERLRTGE